MRRLWGTFPLILVFGCASAGDDPYGTNSTDPPVEKDPYWASGSPTNEGASTHLFIVNRAITILGKHTSLPQASKAFARLNNSTCRTRWQLGLDDADHKVSYNNWYTWRSHFYDPSTGTNYTGQTSPVAYNEALKHLQTAKTKLAANDVNNGCYELGLALHYATDMTQPMHAANFAATDRPLDMHSHVEDYAVEIQNGYVASDWNTAPTGTVNTALSNLAWAANSKWPGLWNALGNAYIAKCNDDMDDEYFDTTSCWKGDAGVNAAIGAALRDAQIDTAKFLYAAAIP
ncbi:MAG TPA: hypothetical protein VFV99_26140 [Kofleriaceae bacterium]|nr:hypothetical protein [Kofleriaceae bacterium]